MSPKRADEPLFCARCAVQLTPGRGEFYVVRIEAVADPTPPKFTAEDLQRNIAGELNDLISQLGDLSGQEALDQVYRRMTVQLCVRCYRTWIENPVGFSGTS